MKTKSRHLWKAIGGGSFVCRHCGLLREKMPEYKFTRRYRVVYTREEMTWLVAPICDSAWPSDWLPGKRVLHCIDGRYVQAELFS